MATIVDINDITIPDEDIVEYGKAEQSVEFAGQKLIAATLRITLDDSSREAYNMFYTGSLFYGTSWYNDIIRIYDSVSGEYTWIGRIKKVEIKWDDGKIFIESTNYIQDLVDTTCEYDNTASPESPAEVIYNILTDLIGIPESSIRNAGFENAINVQTANSVLVSVKFSKEHGKNCLAIIQELLRISSCFLFTQENIIHLWQFEVWNGELGYYIIHDDNIIADSLEIRTIDDQLFNDYKIAYKNGTYVGFVTGDDTASQTAYRVTKTFTVPDELPDSTECGDYRILLTDDEGAAWCGDLALTRCKNIQYEIEFILDNIDGTFDYLQINTQLDVNIAPFTREPIRITKLTNDKDARNVRITGVFLNLPVNVVSRDTTPPAPVGLVALLPKKNGMLIKWTRSIETDHLGYTLYFTVSRGAWKEEYCHLGQSPITVINPGLSFDGYCIKALVQLENAEYFFMLKSYDTSYNESGPSNVVSAMPLLDYETLFNCEGDIYEEINLANIGGTLPDDYTHRIGNATFGELTFGPSGIFQSGVYCNLNGFTLVRWKAFSTDGIDYQVRTRGENTQWTAWSPRASADGLKSHSFSGETCFQIRFLFRAGTWNGDDYFYISEVV